MIILTDQKLKQEESLDYHHGGERKSWEEEERLEAMVNLC
jgi:hypothetical protein